MRDVEQAAWLVCVTGWEGTGGSGSSSQQQQQLQATFLSHNPLLVVSAVCYSSVTINHTHTVIHMCVLAGSRNPSRGLNTLSKQSYMTFICHHLGINDSVLSFC